MSNEKLLATIRDAARSTGYVTNSQSYEVAEAVAAALPASEGAAPVAVLTDRQIDGLLAALSTHASQYDDDYGLPHELAHMRKIVRERITTPQPAVNGAGLSDANDGARYRFIRENSCPVGGVLEVLTIDTPPVHLHGERMDGAIDALMAGKVAAPTAPPAEPPAEALAEAQRVGREIAADIAKCVEKGERMFDAPTAEADAKPIATLHRRNYAGTQTYALNPTRSEDGTMPWEALPVGDYPLYTRPAAPLSEVTDAMVDAYLTANDAYWQRTDQLTPAPSRWRAGNVKDATRESLRAAIAATSVGEGEK